MIDEIDNPKIPYDYREPDWTAARPGDWKYEVSDEVREDWPTYTDLEKQTLAMISAGYARDEDDDNFEWATVH